MTVSVLSASVQPSPPSLTPVRIATPLEQTLLRTLAEKDLGNTGFVTARELESALTQQLPPDKAVSALYTLQTDSCNPHLCLSSENFMQ